MKRVPWLLTIVPSRWRDSVASDLQDEADGRALAGWRRRFWISWHVVAIGAALRMRGATMPVPVRARRQRSAGLRADVMSAVRMLVHEPATSATIVVTLSLGIAATSAVYAVFNHVAFRPTPGVHDPATLVSILFQPEDEPRTWAYGSPDAVSVFQAADAAVLAVAVRSGSPSPTVFAVRPGDMPRLVDVGYVAPSYFEVLGVRPRIGRLFSKEETTDGAPVALVSEALWRREYGQRPDVLGTSLYVKDRPYTIVGVVDDYRGWSSTAANTGDVWLPEPEADARSSSVSLLVARVVPGTSPEALQAAFRAAYEPLRTQVPARMANFVPWVYPGLRDGPSERHLGASFPRVVTVACLFALLACANAANLLLARHGRRWQGLNVRRAIGASRWRLMRPLAVEALCLALLAVAGGLGGTWLLVRLVDGVQVFSHVAALRDVGIDWRVSAFAAAAGVCTVLAFALVPIVLATRNEARIAFDRSARTTTSAHRMRATLVAAQIALSLALMTTAVLMTRSLGSLRAVDLGMAPAGVMSFTLNPRLIGATGAGGEQLTRRAIEALQAMPGVAAVGTANPSPFNESRNSRLLRHATPDGEIDRFSFLRTARPSRRSNRRAFSPGRRAAAQPCGLPPAARRPPPRRRAARHRQNRNDTAPDTTTNV